MIKNHVKPKVSNKFAPSSRARSKRIARLPVNPGIGSPRQSRKVTSKGKVALVLPIPVPDIQAEVRSIKLNAGQLARVRAALVHDTFTAETRELLRLVLLKFQWSPARLLRMKQLSIPLGDELHPRYTRMIEQALKSTRDLTHYRVQRVPVMPSCEASIAEPGRVEMFAKPYPIDSHHKGQPNVRQSANPASMLNTLELLANWSDTCTLNTRYSDYAGYRRMLLDSYADQRQAELRRNCQPSAKRPLPNIPNMPQAQHAEIESKRIWFAAEKARDYERWHQLYGYPKLSTWSKRATPDSSDLQASLKQAKIAQDAAWSVWMKVRTPENKAKYQDCKKQVNRLECELIGLIPPVEPLVSDTDMVRQKLVNTGSKVAERTNMVHRSYVEFGATPATLADIESAIQDVNEDVENGIAQLTIADAASNLSDNWLLIERNQSSGTVKVRSASTQKSAEWMAKQVHLQHPNYTTSVISRIQARAAKIDTKLLAD